MTEREDGDFVPNKKFKSSQENNYETSCGCHKGNVEAEAGNYFLGPVIRKYVKAPVTQCLARRKGTDNYYLMKILLLDESDSSVKCSFVRRTVFHNEYSFLTLLKDHFGVVQLCDFFKDYIYKESSDSSNKTKLKRICMVLECLIPHGHHNTEFTLLKHYLKENRLSEVEALYIFYNLLLVVEDLHKKNIVHRDLKLSNIILNRKTLKVKLIDFYYAKLLISGSEVQHSQCRVFSSAEAMAGHPALPKTCDMWSAGVILYGMLTGCKPFPNSVNYGHLLSSSCSLRELYLKIMENDCTLLNNSCISDGTKELLRNILWKMPQFRLKASEAVDMVSTLLALQCTSQNPSLLAESKCSDQVVPECPDFDLKDRQDRTPTPTKKSPSTPEGSTELESDFKNAKQKIQKTTTNEENFERPPSPPATSKLSQQNGLLNRKEVKYAMLRLGVTSVNSINALSFNYNKKTHAVRNLCDFS